MHGYRRYKETNKLDAMSHTEGGAHDLGRCRFII